MNLLSSLPRRRRLFSVEKTVCAKIDLFVPLEMRDASLLVKIPAHLKTKTRAQVTNGTTHQSLKTYINDHIAMPTKTVEEITSGKDVSTEEQVLLVIAKLMEGGHSEEHTCRYLDTLTKVLSKESDGPSGNPKASKKDNASTNSTSSTETPIYRLIDTDSFETIMEYLDMRRSPTVRGHATLTTSAYLKASEDQGTRQLINFFKTHVSKTTYDDLILAFSVAASIFPIVPQICSEMFLTEGFIPSLGPIMNQKWKTKKVEQAALEMLNAACMNAQCREAVQKYCQDWVEEIVVNEPNHPSEIGSPERAIVVEDGPLQLQMHPETTRNLAGVILAKLQVRPSFIVSL